MSKDRDLGDSFGPWDAGLREGFGAAARASVIANLERRTGSSLRLALPDADTDRDPVVRLVGPDGASAMGSRYQVLGEIARGGIGAVMKGRDQDLGRDVAIKVLHERFKDDRAVIERFVEEAQIGGQLQHPGIVPVYELGLQADERPFFAMKLVKGDTLAALLKRRRGARDDLQRFLRVFLQICQTVAYAHVRRVVHRDLKPSNVLIGAFGEVQVVDWGLAKVLRAGGTADERTRPREISVIETVRSAEGSSHSVAGSVMGTPAYMSPEQARGEVEGMDARSDVFSLGAVLVEILSGTPLYASDDARELLAAASSCRTAPALERLAREGVDDALVELVHECLAPAPNARPDDAGVVAGRVEAYLQSVDDRARRAEVRAAEVRVRARAGLAVAALLAVGIALSSVLWVAWKGERDERRLDARRRADSAVAEATLYADQARQAGLAGVELWTSALGAARRAAEIVAEGEVDPELATEVRALVAELEQNESQTRAEALREESHELLLERMREARIGPDVPRDDVMNGNRRRKRDSARRMADYAEILGGLGLDVDTPFEELASAVECAHRARFAQALDATAEATRVAALYDDSIEPEGWRHWVRLARRLDPEDPWRNALRDELVREELDSETLGRLAEPEALAARGPEEIATLVALIDAAGDARGAVDAQLQALFVHPTDFWLNVSFSGVCTQTPMLLRLYLERAQWTTRAAVALRPESRRARYDTAWPNLISDVDKGLAILDELLDEDPRNTDVVSAKVLFLAREGRFEEAIEMLPDSAAADGSETLLPDYIYGFYAPVIVALGHGDRLLESGLLPPPQRGLVQFVMGRTAEAWRALEQMLDVETPDPTWTLLAPLLREAPSPEGFAATYERLRAIAEGDEAILGEAEPRELVAASALVGWGVGEPTHGVELVRRARAARPADDPLEPSDAEGQIYVTAAYASAGLTPATSRLGADERSALRRVALDALNRELDSMEADLAAPDLPEETLAEIEDMLSGLVLNGMLAPIRSPRFLAEMPPEDAHACRLLRARVAGIAAMMMELASEG